VPADQRLGVDGLLAEGTDSAVVGQCGFHGRAAVLAFQRLRIDRLSTERACSRSIA